MDLRLGAAAPATDEERAAVASVLGPPVTGWDGGQRTAADGHAAYGGHAARAQRVTSSTTVTARAAQIEPSA